MSPTHERWTPRFHLAPRQGWLNDPNGLCQFHGTYHVFYQAAPAWPASGKKGWGHFASRDLVRWEDLGEPLVPSIPEDADGVYSGSALVVAGGLGNAFDRFLRLQNYLSVKQFPLRNSGPGGEATFFICRGTALQPLQRGAKLVHPELCICQLPVALCGKALPAWI